MTCVYIAVCVPETCVMQHARINVGGTAIAVLSGYVTVAYARALAAELLRAARAAQEEEEEHET